MTLQRVAAEIGRLAKRQLEELGLTVVPDPSNEPDSEDHSIKFVDARGRSHAVSVQVSSYSPSLAKSSLSIEHVELRPIDGTRYSCVESGWSHVGLRSKSTEARVQEIVDGINAHNWFKPVDDLEAGVVTDFRWETVIPKLREHFFDGDVRLSRSAAGRAIDTVEILDDGKVAAKAVFVRPAIIEVSYCTLAGGERVLSYNGLVRFNENIDKDIGSNAGPTPISGPRI